MNITDIFNNASSKKINETIEKTFGKKVDLENFSLQQLEDSRNRLRTQLYTIRNSSGFNETVNNESYTKAQWMLDAINAEVMQRKAISESLAREGAMDEAHAELARIANEEDFDALYDLMTSTSPAGQWAQDQAADIAIDHHLHSDDDHEQILELLMDRVVDYFGGGEDDYDETDDAYALASAGHGSDEDYESVENEAVEDTTSYKIAQELIKQGVTYSPEREKEIIGKIGNVMQQMGFDNKSIRYHLSYDEDFIPDVLSDLPRESVNQGEDMTQVRESATDKASAVVTAKTMVDRVGRWIEELAGMENDTLLSLGDTIRDEMGQEQAKSFLSAVAPAIQQALENLKATRETLATGVRSLTGEVQPAELIGADGEGAAPEGEMGPAEPDAMNAGGEEEFAAGEEGAPEEDEFAAAEPAAGGMEVAGRAQRESIERGNQLLRVLAG